jgi:hypothetical protein
MSGLANEQLLGVYVTRTLLLKFRGKVVSEGKTIKSVIISFLEDYVKDVKPGEVKKEDEKLESIDTGIKTTSLVAAVDPERKDTSPKAEVKEVKIERKDRKQKFISRGQSSPSPARKRGGFTLFDD